jgi:hypothetical protein
VDDERDDELQQSVLYQMNHPELVIATIEVIRWASYKII